MGSLQALRAVSDVPCGLQKILVLDIVLAEKLKKRPIWMEDDHVAVKLW
jgi:hypothetical protein